MYTILDRKTKEKKSLVAKKQEIHEDAYIYKTREATKGTGNNSLMSNQKFTICTHGTEQIKKQESYSKKDKERRGSSKALLTVLRFSLTEVWLELERQILTQITFAVS